MPSFTKFLCAVNELVNIPADFATQIFWIGNFKLCLRSGEFACDTDNHGTPRTGRRDWRRQPAEAGTHVAGGRPVTVNSEWLATWLAMPALQNGFLLARQSRHATSGGQVRVEVALLREAQAGLEPPNPRQRVWRLQPCLGRGEKQ